MEALILLVVKLIILGLIAWVIWWAVGAIGVPEPFNKVIRVIIILVFALILLYFLIGLLDSPGQLFPRR